MTLKKQYKGFTLIELMVVMAIIAVLATLIIGSVQLARRTATETTHRANSKTIQTALEGTFAKGRAYCGNTGQIACGTYSFADAAGDEDQGSSTAITNNFDIKIGTAACVTGATATAPNAGGGSVVIGASTYTITPQNFDCSDTLANDILSM